MDETGLRRVKPTEAAVEMTSSALDAPERERFARTNPMARPRL